MIMLQVQHTRLVFTSPQWPEALSTNRNQLKLWHGYVITTMVQCSAIINNSQFSPKYSQQTPHSSPLRVRYGFFLWVPALINVLHRLLQSWMHYHALLHRIIMAPSISWDVFTHPYPKFKIEIMEWMSNYISHKTLHVITCTCPNFSQISVN